MRPRRHTDRTVRLVAYVNPFTLAAFQVQAEVADVPLGVILDGYAGSGPVITKEDVVKPISTLPPLRNHVWRHSATRGNFCEACKGLKSKVEGTNCVPIDENPAEEAHLTQKGPK